MYPSLVRFIREQYRSDDFIPLHAPIFVGREREFVLDTIDSTYVSSVGAFVDRFEREMAGYTGAERAVAVVNGTAALHVALMLAGVQAGDLVVTQALTFVASCNAIMYCGAQPAFVDVDRDCLGLSPAALETWLQIATTLGADGACRTRADGRVVRACLPMHTFGHPADLDGLLAVCARWNLVLVEDAAESLGSLYHGRHTGTFGRLAALSFNGNKILTTGAGGMVLSDETLGKRAKHLTTTAKQPHPYEFHHDELGFNYRMPNLNAALGCAQFELLDRFVAAKRALAAQYDAWFAATGLRFVREPEGCRANYWLNAVVCESREQRDEMLKATNDAGVMTRPIWQLMYRLPMYRDCMRGDLANSEWLEARVINLPSSVPTGLLDEASL